MLNFVKAPQARGLSDKEMDITLTGNLLLDALNVSFCQRYLVEGTCQVCLDKVLPLGNVSQGGVNVRKEGRLRLTVAAKAVTRR